MNKNNYLNFAGTRKWNSQRHRLARSGGPLSEDTCGACSVVETSRSIIRAAWLRRLPVLHLRSSNQVVYLGSSSPAREMGTLIPGAASRLDAFSAYPFWT